MNSTDRHEQILNLLRTRTSVQIVELSDALEVSRETVRKDLTELDQQGLLTKVRGGAISKGTTTESAYDARSRKNKLAKQEIAARAAHYVDEGMSIFLDYGTTTYMLAAELMNYHQLTVVTNALPIANLLSTARGVTIIIPGGVLRSNENSLYGPPTLRNLDHLNMDIGFFGCAGVDPEAGVTNHHMFETSVSTHALGRCRRRVLLADSSKLGVIAANTTARLSDFDYLISDSSDATALYSANGEDGPEVIITEGSRS